MSWKVRAALAAVFALVLVCAIYDRTVNNSPDASVGIVMSSLGLIGWGGLAIVKKREIN